MGIQNQMELLPGNIKEIAEKWSPCTQCPLHNNIFHYVFYRGVSPCEVLFIGDAPGRKENLSGLPFVGRSGSLLDSIIEEVGIDFTFGVTNVISCIPLTDGKVRLPSKEECEACRPRLLSTITAARPKLVVLLGKSVKKHFRLPRALDTIILEVPHTSTMMRKGGVNSLEYKKAVVYLRDKLEEMGKDGKERVLRA